MSAASVDRRISDKLATRSISVGGSVVETLRQSRNVKEVKQQEDPVSSAKVEGDFGVDYYSSELGFQSIMSGKTEGKPMTEDESQEF